MLKIGLMVLQTSENFDLSILYLSIVLAIVFLFIGLSFTINKIKKIKRVLEVQAIKRNGELQGLFRGSYPVLKFNHNSEQVKVYSTPGGRNTPPCTYVCVTLSLPVSHHMRLYKEGFGSKIGKKLGMQDIQVGIDSFDRDIMVKGSDEFFIRNILTYGIQDLVLRIINNHRADIILDRNRLRIIVQKIVYDETTYDDLIDPALKIADQIKKAESKR